MGEGEPSPNSVLNYNSARVESIRRDELGDRLVALRDGLVVLHLPGADGRKHRVGILGLAPALEAARIAERENLGRVLFADHHFLGVLAEAALGTTDGDGGRRDVRELAGDIAREGLDVAIRVFRAADHLAVHARRRDVDRVVAIEVGTGERERAGDLVGLLAIDVDFVEGDGVIRNRDDDLVVLLVPKADVEVLTALVLANPEVALDLARRVVEVVDRRDLGVVANIARDLAGGLLGTEGLE